MECRERALVSGACAKHQRTILRTTEPTDPTWRGHVVRAVIRNEIAKAETNRAVANIMAAVDRKLAAQRRTQRKATKRPTRASTPTSSTTRTAGEMESTRIVHRVLPLGARRPSLPGRRLPLP